MAATNFTPIQLYHSTSASAVPTAANLAQGELAININDGKLYYEDSTGVVQVIATKGAGTIGGSTTQIQYNNAGALAGNAAMVFNNSTNVTTLTTLNLTNALGAIYGGTAQSTYTQGDILYSSATNTLAKLGIGVVNYILTSTGSIPQWVAPSSIAVLTATNLAGGLAGSVPYQSALDTTTFLAIGAANRVMTSTGTAPQWVTSLTGLTGVSSSSITDSGLTSGRVTFASTGGLLVDSSSLTFNGTTLTTAGLSNSGFSTLVKTLTLGDTSFNGTAVFAPTTPAKLYMGTGTVTDVTSAISATNTTGAISSLDITPIAATNTGVTYTNASTLYIAGAPSAGTNVTITNPYSLYVAGGAVNLGGNTAVTGTLSATGDATIGSTAANGRIRFGNGTNTFIFGSQAGDAMSLGTGNTDRIVISSTGLAVTGTLSSTLGATIQGLTVGLGAGAVASNTAVGAGALAANTTGASNTAIGGTDGFYGSVLKANLGGIQNVGIGNAALASNISGSGNVAIGFQSGSSVTTASNNTSVGLSALQLNTASSNTAVGYQAGYSGVTATEVVAIGSGALKANTVNYGTAVGFNALTANTTGNANAAFGAYALSTNTIGEGNSAFGALGFGLSDSALQANLSGSYNSAFGLGALAKNTTASNNTAVGYQAGYTSQASSYNTFLGYQAGYTSNAGGTGLNTCVGYVSGYSLTTGTSNLIIGTNPSTGAGYSMTTGSKNTLVGGFSGNQDSLDIRTASNYVVLSDGDGARQITMKEGQTLALDSAVPNAGTGITFPATQSASSNANTLDDYEEGTWTPGQGNLTLSAGTFVSSGTYTKIGRTVYFTYIVTTNDPATQTVSISASGATALNLPFAEAFSGTSTAYDYSSVGVVTQVASSRVYFYSTVSSRAQITGGGVYSV